jgi:hypothetical protein
LQERLIPVLTARYRHAKGMANQRYRIVASAESPVMGHHRISASFSIEVQHQLAFGGSATVELRLEAIDDTEIAVELVDAPGANIVAGAVAARLDTPFELLFRLTGPRPLKTRVRLVGALDEGDVVPLELERRFTVEATAPRDASSEAAPTETAGSWLSDLPEGGVRAVFAHIDRFGAINETEATAILGNPRAFRRFSQQFEKFAERAPFEVQIDVASGLKRYVREGN